MSEQPRDTTFKREKHGGSKIEKAHPVLTELVAQLGHGAAIYYRAGEWWLSPWDKQITYRFDTGRKCDTPEAKAATAEKIVRTMLDARKQPGWGTLAERAERIWRGLLTSEYRPQNFCYYGHPSGDTGCKMHGIGSWYASMELVGEERIESRDCSFDGAMSALAAKAHEAFGMPIDPATGRPT